MEKRFPINCRLSRWSDRQRISARGGCWALTLLTFLFAPAANAGEIRDVSMVVGHGWAVIREIRQLGPDSGGQMEIRFQGVPPEADLSTMLIRSRRFAVDVKEWGREGDGKLEARGQQADAGLTQLANGAVRWARNAPSSVSDVSGAATSAVRCVLASPLPQEAVALDLIYVVRGFDWKATYQIAVRGDQVDEKEPVSIDLLGFASVHNPTARTYSDAVVWLVGSDEGASKAGRPDEPGFLVLDEFSPLADLWRYQPPEEAISYEYALSRPADVLGRADTDIRFVEATRRPAERLYSMDSELFPFSQMGRSRPLTKIIVFQNKPERGLGYALPPGPAQIFSSSRRSHLLQEAWLPHTPAGGEIRINLGLSDEVQGYRQSLARTDTVNGYYEEAFQIAVQNRRETPVELEINEKPPANLEWTPLRSSKPYDTVARRLFFHSEVEARNEMKIDYRLRIRQPIL